MTPPTTDTDLRDQIERYRAWLTETLANADGYLRAHPDEATGRDHGVLYARFEALHMLGKLVPPGNVLTLREPAQR